MEMSQVPAPSRTNSLHSAVSSASLSQYDNLSPAMSVGVAGAPLVQTVAGPCTISAWNKGLRLTVFLMTFFYIIAFLIAIIHLVLFYYLNGKSADAGLHGISQTYVTTASNLLAYLFATTIKISLAVAFAQHLWWIMRQSALKVSTIEVLFNIRSNPIQLFRISAIKRTWVLGLLAAILYIIPIATSFPPGALTVKSTNHVDIVPVPVHTFNASYVGNGSIAGVLSSSLNPWGYNLEFTSNSTWAATFVSNVGNVLIGSLQRLTLAVVVTGQPLAIPSPCGANCSYTMQFEGPVFDCIPSVKTTTISESSSFGDEVDWDQAALSLEEFYFSEGIAGNFTNATSSGLLRPPPLFYEGTWNYPGGIATLFGPNDNQSESQGVYTEASFEVSTLNSSNFFVPPVTLTQSNLSCIPSRALYTVTNSYIDNVQNLTYTTGSPTQLTNTRRLAFLNGTYSGISAPDYPAGDLVGNWSDETLKWWRDCQLMAFAQQISYPLNGTYFTNTFYTNTSGMLLQKNSLLGGIGPASNFIANSPLSTTFQDYDLSAAQDSGEAGSSMSFNVTQEALNKMLGDLTISAVVAYGMWSDTVNVTKSLSGNVYSFSQPVNLFVPYFLTLALSLPFLFIGLFALYKNGIPAADGGFYQILSTTTGSPTLQKAAAGNCLGGEEISEELKNLEIRFGELMDMQMTSGGKLIRRAGFGTKGEVGNLLKGESYGYANI